MNWPACAGWTASAAWAVAAAGTAASATSAAVRVVIPRVSGAIAHLRFVTFDNATQTWTSYCEVFEGRHASGVGHGDVLGMGRSD